MLTQLQLKKFQCQPHSPVASHCRHSIFNRHSKFAATDRNEMFAMCFQLRGIYQSSRAARAGRQAGEPRQLESTLTDRRIPRLSLCLSLSLSVCVCLATSISMSTICCRVRLRVCLSPSVATFGAEATLLPAGEGSLSAFVAQYKLNLALAKEEERRRAEGAGKW